MSAAPNMKKRLLIIEDDKIVVASLQRKLKNIGIEADGCFDGEAGMAFLKKNHYDGIVLDLLMPVKDGFSVLAELSQTKNALAPVYILTSLGENKCAVAREYGVKQVYSKSHMSLAEVVEDLRKEMGV